MAGLYETGQAPRFQCSEMMIQRVVLLVTLRGMVRTFYRLVAIAYLQDFHYKYGVDIILYASMRGQITYRFISEQRVVGIGDVSQTG